MKILQKDIAAIRELAKHVKEISQFPIQEIRRKEFIRHNELKKGKPFLRMLHQKRLRILYPVTIKRIHNKPLFNRPLK